MEQSIIKKKTMVQQAEYGNAYCNFVVFLVLAPHYTVVVLCADTELL